MGHVVWDDIKILGNLVCPFVCMSVCVYIVGRCQKFDGVPYQEYCVYYVFTLLVSLSKFSVLLLRRAAGPALPGRGVPRVPQHDPQGVQGLPPGDQPQDDGEEEGAQRHGRQVAAPVADAAAEDARKSGEEPVRSTVHNECHVIIGILMPSYHNRTV